MARHLSVFTERPGFALQRKRGRDDGGGGEPGGGEETIIRPSGSFFLPRQLASLTNLCPALYGAVWRCMALTDSSCVSYCICSQSIIDDPNCLSRLSFSPGGPCFKNRAPSRPSIVASPVSGGFIIHPTWIDCQRGGGEISDRLKTGTDDFKWGTPLLGLQHLNFFFELSNFNPTLLVQRPK